MDGHPHGFLTDSTTNHRLSYHHHRRAQRRSLCVTALVALGCLTAAASAYEIPSIVWQDTLHSTSATAVTYSPDGAVVASGSAGPESAVQLSSATDGTPQGTLTGHADGVIALAYHAGGNLLAAGHYDTSDVYPVQSGLTHVWDLSLATVRHTFGGGFVGISADGGRLASAGWGVMRDVEVHDPNSGFQFADVYTGDYITALGLSSDGMHTAIGRYEGAVDVYDEAGNMTGTADHAGPVRAIASAPGSAVFATAGQTEGGGTTSIRLWTYPAATPAGTLTADDTYISALAFSPDGDYLVSAGSDAAFDRLLRVWRVSDGELLHTFDVGDSAVNDVAVAPDASQIAYVQGDGTVSVINWPVETNGYWKAGWQADLSTLFHQVDGVATIIDATTIQVDNFDYDGTAPAVYFYLGTEDSQSAFLNGLEVMPQLTRAYNDESITITLPAGETLDDWNAISVWCAAFDINFGSGEFGPVLCVGDANCDGFINFRDIDYFVAAQNDNVSAWESLFGGTPSCLFANNDVNGDGFVNFRDIDAFVAIQNTTCP